MYKKFFVSSILLCLAANAFAGGKEAAFWAIWRHPEILLEPWFWIVVVVCLVLVGIYYITKDKK